MKLEKFIEEINTHRHFDDALKDKIVAYFNGNIEFEDLGLSKEFKSGRWYLDSYLKGLKEVLKDESYKQDTLKRLCKLYFALLKKDDLAMVASRLDMSRVSEVYNEFYEEVIDKATLMKMVFKKNSDWALKDGAYALYKSFGSKDAIDYVVNGEKLKIKEHYRGEYNLYAIIKLEDLTRVYEAKKYNEVKEITLDILSSLADDYKATNEFISRKNVKRVRDFRESLGDEGKKALLELIDTGNNWEVNIEILRSRLKITKSGRIRRSKYALLEDDYDFESLYTKLRVMEVGQEGLEFISRFNQMMLELAPNEYIEKSFYEDRGTCNDKSTCAWKDARVAINQLKANIENNKGIEKQLVEYFIMYTIEHFRCSYATHSEVFKLLIDEFGSDYVMKHMKTRGITDEVEAIYLMDKYGDKNLVSERKKELESMILTSLFRETAIEPEAAISLKAYVNGELDKVNTKKLLKKEITSTGEYREYHLFSGEKLERLVRVILESKNKDLYKLLPSSFYKGDETELPHKFMLEKLVKLDINTKEILKVIVEYVEDNERWLRSGGSIYYNGHYYPDNILAKMLEYLEDNGIKCLELGAKFNGKLKKYLIDSIYGEKKVKREVLYLVDLLGEKQKGFVEGVKNKLLNLDESIINIVEEKIYNEIEGYKGEKEVFAVEVLCNYKSDETKMKKIYSIVTEPKSRDFLADALGLELKDLFVDKDGEFDLDAYLDSVYKKSKKQAIELDKVVKPVRKDGKGVDRALEQLIISYQNSDELSINKEALTIAERFEEKSIADFARSILTYWQNGKMDMKSKWQLLIPIIHGDYTLIKELAELIEGLAKNSRQKLAVYLIKALGLNGSNEAFVAIDKIGRRTKFKTLRLASQEAFEIAARELGISKGELGDQLVGDMGLVDGHITLDYGNQVVKLFIGANLKFEIEKADGKRVKTLPKGSKEDDENLVAEAKDKFKLLKKQLKEMVTLQTNRMEDALIDHRTWTSKAWKELFLNNPIMNSIGKSLLWGIYEGDKLIKAFAYNTDLFDVDYEDVSIEDTDKIGLVHTLELDRDNIKAWKEVFEDNEVEVLFGQLDREVLEVADDKALEFRPVDYPRKAPNTLVTRLQKKGWSIGSVRDAGGFDEVYKEIRALNIGIELTLDETPYMDSYGYEAYNSDDGCVGVGKIEFYRLGKVQRGSYVYDELERHNGLRYKAEELSKRIVSELLLELKRGLS